MSGHPEQEKPFGLNIVACLQKYCVFKESNFKFIVKKYSILFRNIYLIEVS